MKKILCKNIIFKNKDFNFLIIGQFISFIGTLIQKFALSLYVLKITGSGTMFASILVVALIPRIVLGPICGVFADWYDRRKIMIYLDLISGFVIGIMFYISVTVGLRISHIYICVMIMSVISSLYNPAVSTTIPSIVDDDELIKANSIENFVMTSGNIIGPILASIIYTMYGITIVLLINSISFILSSILEIFMNLPKVKRKKTSNNVIKQFFSDFTEGIKFIYNKKIIFQILCCALVANIVMNPIFSIGVPFICKMTLKTTDGQYGFCESVIVAGTIIGPILANIVSKKIESIKLFYLVLVTSGGLISIMAIATSQVSVNFFNGYFIPFVMFLILGFTIGSIVTILNICLSTMIQKETPNEFMGRISASIGTITMCAIPFGQMIFGILFDKINSFLVLISAAIVLILTGVIFKFSYNNVNKSNSMIDLVKRG